MPLVFLGVTFAITWIAWLSADALSPGAAATGASSVVFYLGVFAPGIVAVVMTWQAEGRAAAGTLLGRLFRSQVGLRWYAFALGYIWRSSSSRPRCCTGSSPANGPGSASSR